MSSIKDDQHHSINDRVIINNIQQPSERKESLMRKWGIPLVTTFIGIIATIIVAWYQMKIGEEQAFEAAIEREKAVIQNVVKIVEEHVINNNSVDIPRLARLIDLRSKEEKIQNKISVLQIIQKAEFNIINSDYLEFNKKNEYKKIFDNIYSQMNFDGLDGYDGLHANVANELAKSIRGGDSQTAITTLNSLLDLLNKDITEAKERNSYDFLSILKIFDKDFMFMLLGIQFVLMLTLTYFRIVIKRMREKQEFYKYYKSKLDLEM
ncbi:hypothetical protein [Aeromonas hydrophila]|uniref:hypothetical protein n=1 Tax=Aeromonas hydrophila TaxID=644 RepID=UPI00111C27C2|nr:hypothetical protein [Aeromonas hydrophila]